MLGFFGSAPLAWPYLSTQAENGDFARGVGVFFFVTAVGGIVSGAFGLLLGTGVGWAWEHAHRYRRRRSRAVNGAPAPAAYASSMRSPPVRVRPTSDFTGRTLESITYRLDSIELGFGSISRRAAMPNLTIKRGDQACHLVEAEARDMLHTLLGQTVQRVAETGNGTIELEFLDGASIRGL